MPEVMLRGHSLLRDHCTPFARLHHHPSSHSGDPGSSSHRAGSDGEGEGHAHKRRISCEYPAERGELDQFALREHSELRGSLHSMDQMVETQECALATDTGRHKLLPAQLVPDHQSWRDLWVVLEGKESGPPIRIKLRPRR